MIRKMNSSDFEKVYKLVCHLEETCFDLDKMKMIMNELIHSHDISLKTMIILLDISI